MNLKKAILETLAYSDVFDYPLTLEELHCYLGLSTSREDISACLQEMDLIQQRDNYYYFLQHADNIVLRKKREMISSRMYGRAMFYGRLLGKLPFVRMVALTGSLAVRNCDETGDYDYMLVTIPGRVWMARIFALVLNKFANIFGETICPNLIVSENVLEWKSQNLYYAHEIVQMVLMSGNDTYHNLCMANQWVSDYLPNWKEYKTHLPAESPSVIQKTLEFFLSGKLGDAFEAWEMKRKISKLSKRTGFGIETNFNADTCQGNFDHHGSTTLDKLQSRMQQINIGFFDLSIHEQLEKLIK